MKLSPKASTIIGYVSLIAIGIGNMAHSIATTGTVDLKDILLLLNSVLPSAFRSKEA